MSREKVLVEDLEYGMYVTELDRPWLETDFLFQGFVIRNAEDLRRLQAQCEWVCIDTLRGEDPEKPDSPKPGKRKPEFKKKQTPRQAAAPSSSQGTVQQAGAVSRPGKVGPVAPREPNFNKALPEAVQARKQVSRFFNEAIRDLGAGRSMGFERAREAVSELEQAVSLNANATIWLNNLRRESEFVAAHCINVSALTLGFARHLGYEGDELHALGTGALLHDIGFLDTPVEILRKPGKLTDDEWKVVRRHAEKGSELATLIPGIPSIAANVIRYHHERLNGRGYPEGLAGKDVPREALIVAIADVYDAMTGEQPWSPAMSPHGTLSVLRQVSPQEFGSELAREFLNFIGIYPVSTLVELASGAVGMVVSHTPKTRLSPVLMMLRNPRGEDVKDRPLVDLANVGEDESDQWQITSVLEPEQVGLDVASITAIYLDRLFG